MEMESYLKPKASQVAQVEPEQSHPDAVIAEVQLKQDAIMRFVGKYHVKAREAGSPDKGRMVGICW